MTNCDFRFMCDLLRQQHQDENMLILKCHGGITDQDIFNVVRKAIKKAQLNYQQGIHLTVLFFDEANTTDSIATVKSVICDRLVDGQPIPNDVGLQFVAAVNPYRQHSQEMIDKLEKVFTYFTLIFRTFLYPSIMQYYMGFETKVMEIIKLE